MFLRLLMHVGVMAVVFNAGESLDCLYCDAEEAISNCRHHILTCSPKEECFLETRLQIIGNQYTKLYYAGCRGTNICNIIRKFSGVMIGRKKRDTTLCTQCCSTADPGLPCNANLCAEGQHVSVIHQGVPASTSSATTHRPSMECFNCNAVSSLSSCKTVKTCPSTMLCSSKMYMVVGSSTSNSVQYELGCMDKYECAQGTKPVSTGRRRGSDKAELCAACCLGDRCNGLHTCYELKTNNTLSGLGLVGK